MTPEIEERFRSLENCQPFQLANYSGVYFLCQGTKGRLRRKKSLKSSNVRRSTWALNSANESSWHQVSGSI